MNREAFFTPCTQTFRRRGRGSQPMSNGSRASSNCPSAASGPGGDVASLLAAAPDAHVTAFDKHPPFVAAVRETFAGNANVTAEVAMLLEPPAGPYDLIWCAGAVYFVGIEAALTAWAPLLTPAGAVAFSEPAYFTPSPSDGAQAFWGGHPVQGEEAVLSQVTEAGYTVLGTRRLSDAA